MSNWIFAAASVRGSSHVRAGTRLQDAKRCFELTTPMGVPVFCSVVSDGAGSAKFGGEGASLVCRNFATSVQEFLEASAELPDEEVIWSWIDDARDRIANAARKRDLTPRDFAATLVFTLATPEEVVLCHIGDGAAVGREAQTGEWVTLSHPENGEYASTTYFITDEQGPRARFQRYDGEFDAVAAFSDGIEGLVIDSKTGSPHPGFFQPVIRPLEASEGHGRQTLLSKQLAQFLASSRINERTDDDKTLVVACRR
ncbi:PP2C family serine/threonine-protein phosphatase [Rhizobium ruizarguesonis]|uniref:PP2C family serine/threonine-protein phosphatase n=1 Tax=Rhizobium ruizarguesonis TaxID=2081791 RepID=UPI0010307505|nr:PP2C family serine/threonine-protein phosphatase [Rhizobium ruizarguesonis]TBD81037.1 protein phosphatase 2C domain-containing protein [Rhizobium ruizarguesonis]TBE12198.1 protein phosphatase 2C domain-containing protein [Rhizobium ruizarguesonis]WSH32157.1 PP2C family serine/threonine-protein phosphatase [Rhizobium ruizarguesonis]